MKKTFFISVLLLLLISCSRQLPRDSVYLYELEDGTKCVVLNISIYKGGISCDWDKTQAANGED